MRSEIRRLEVEAGQAPLEVGDPFGDLEATTIDEPGGAAITGTANANQSFTDSFLRWARLSPPLREEDLSGYLHLAASFAGETVLDRDLPERLRDIAANLMSPARADQYAIADADLGRLPSDDAKFLLQHLGRMARDRPANQRKSVEAVLRLCRQQVALADEGCAALGTIPADEIAVPSLMLFNTTDASFAPVLKKWRSGTTKQTTRNAIDIALGKRG